MIDARDGLEVHSLAEHEADEGERNELEHVAATKPPDVRDDRQQEGDRRAVDAQRRQLAWGHAGVDDEACDNPVCSGARRREGHERVAHSGAGAHAYGGHEARPYALRGSRRPTLRLLQVWFPTLLHRGYDGRGCGEDLRYNPEERKSSPCKGSLFGRGCA